MLFHWTVAAMLLATVVLAWRFEAMPRTPAKRAVVQLHASLGVTIFALTLLRVAWRRRRRPPPLPASMSSLQVRAAHAVHVLLYALLIVQPVTGYLTSVAGGHAPQWFGLFELPHLVPADKQLRATARLLHLGAQWVLYGLVGAHVAAALAHQFHAGDRILQRMLPWPRAR